jgi:hypothetical protein
MNCNWDPSLEANPVQGLISGANRTSLGTSNRVSEVQHVHDLCRGLSPDLLAFNYASIDDMIAL